MKNIKLYIDNKIADLVIDELDLALTKQIIDFQDISKRTGSFSYSLNLPRSKVNKNIFKFIDDLDVINKFKKTTNYECSLYVNDNLMIEGVFNLFEINEKFFIGNICNKNIDIFSKIGEKYLQDLLLPTIDFEGVFINYDVDGTSGFNYNTGFVFNLNKDLGFGVQALLQAYKDPSLGLLNASLDLRNYFTTNYLNYSNQYVPSEIRNNVFTSNISLEDIMPRIRLNRVLEQIFLDIDYKLIIGNDFLNDDKILIPYVGDESPKWNWGHLSKSFINTSKNNIQGTVVDGFFTSEQYFGNYELSKAQPIINSEYYLNSFPDLTYYASSRYIKKIFSDFNLHTNYNIPQNSDTTKCQFERNGNATLKLHYTPTNNIVYDYNNNFNIPAQAPALSARDSGWLYTAPIDGEYQFDVTNFHDLRTFYDWFVPSAIAGSMNYPDDDTMKGYMNMSSYAGYDSGWEYNSNERYYWQNCVIFAKVSDEDNFYNYFEDTFNSNKIIPQAENFSRARSAKMLSNFLNENVVAFYHPLLRDLHIGDLGRNLEDYFDAEQSILKHSSTIPTDIDDRGQYMGFNADTTLLKYDNQITTSFNGGFSNFEQKKRKLVKIGKTPYFGEFNGNYHICRKAEGFVDFNFKTTLKKGEQIRMYYLTFNQLKQYATEYNGINPVPFPNRSFSDLVPWNDLYTDDMKISAFGVKCISETETKLKLSNFLPKDLKQKDLLTDYLKTFNLYFDVNTTDKTITLKKRDDFFSEFATEDFTDRVNSLERTITPNTTYKQTDFGIKILSDDDLSDNTSVSNPVRNFNITDNIYATNEILDNTSKIFYQAEKRSFVYNSYNYTFDSRYNLQTGDTKKDEIKLLNFTESGDINIKNQDSAPTLDRSPRIILDSDEKIYITKKDYVTLINSTPFKGNEFFYTYNAEPFFSNEKIYQNLINDRFLDLSDTCYVEFNMYINDLQFSKIDLSKPIIISNTLYYIQKVDKYDPLNKRLTKILLLKK